MSDNWYGRSLGYFRTMFGLPGVWGSCREVINFMKENSQMELDYRPAFGCFVWFDTPYGDMGLYLDNGWTLILVDGRPQVVRLDEYHFSKYVGWSRGIPRPDGHGWLQPGDRWEKREGRMVFIRNEEGK